MLAVFKPRWQCVKLLVKELSKVLPQVQSEYLGNVLDMAYFGAALVWDLRLLEACAPDARARLEKEKLESSCAGLERIAKSIKGIGLLKQRLSIAETMAGEVHEPDTENKGCSTLRSCARVASRTHSKSTARARSS